MFRFNTDAIEPRHRFEFWADTVNRSYTPLQMEPAGEAPFRGEIAIESVGGFEIVLAGGAGHRTRRTQAEIARSSEHFYVATLHLTGQTTFVTPKDQVQLKRGDLLFIDTMHEIGFDLSQPYRSLQVKFPKDWIDSRIARPEHLTSSVLSRDNPWARLFAGYLTAGFRVADKLPASAAEMYGQHLTELLVEAFATSEPAGTPALAAKRAALYMRARRAIAMRLGESHLSPRIIANDVGISTRSLHRVFAEYGETVMQRVMCERVECAARLLAFTGARRRTITDIAFACGFNDLTHFGRIFAERMGVPPSQWRKQSLS